MSDDILLKHSRLPRKAPATSPAGASPTLPTPQTSAPSQQISPRTRAQPANTKVPRSHLPSILARYLNLERMEDIAKEYNTSDAALYHNVLTRHDEEWLQAKLARAAARVDRAEEGIDGAADPLSLARARESFRAGFAQLQALHKRFRQDSGGESQAAPVLTINIIRNNELDNVVVVEREKGKDLT